MPSNEARKYVLEQFSYRIENFDPCTPWNALLVQLATQAAEAYARQRDQAAQERAAAERAKRERLERAAQELLDVYDDPRDFPIAKKESRDKLRAALLDGRSTHDEGWQK